MVTETFRFIDYSNEDLFFQNESGRIELKQYVDNLLFLSNFDSTFEAQYGEGDLTPQTIGSPSILEFDAFTTGKHAELTGNIYYDEENFRDLTNTGTIRFFLRSGFENAYGYQYFTNNTVTIAADDTYSFKLSIDDTLINTYTVSLVTTDTITDVFNKIATAIIGSGASAFQDGSDYIYIQTDTLGRTILLEDPDSGNSLLTLLGGVEDPKILNGPSSDLDFFDLYNGTDNKNRIILTHTTTSHILLKMYDSVGNLDVDEDLGEWNNIITEWYLFELNFNRQLGQFFINGEQQHLFATNNLYRNEPRTILYLNGNTTDYHKIDELILFNNYQNNSNYAIPTEPLLPYPKSNPYIDINFGSGFADNEVIDMNLVHESCHFTVMIGQMWYYYLSGSWRQGDGTYSNSNSGDTFETKFSELYFSEDQEIIVRAFFNSDGSSLAYLDLIEIITEEGAAEQAIIIGNVSITDPIDMTTNKYVVITTDQGTVEVDLSSAALDPSAVTLDEIIDAINNANIPGLIATTDEENRIVLQSETSGTSSYVSITDGTTASILPLVWGTAEEDYGALETPSGDFADYSDLFRYVRSRLGAPLVPVELTDEQLEDCLTSAIYHYNKWRNFEEKIVYTSLSGNSYDGYDIPAVVPSTKDITEIVLQPKYPVNYYAGRNDLMANIFIKEMFGSESIMRGATDYYISLVASRDLNIVLDTVVKWEIVGKKLYVYPLPDASLKIGIKYKSPMSIDEIVTQQRIRDLTLAEAKITLGNIRSTFGNQIPGGEGFLQLNGSELKAEGNEEKRSIIEGWQRSTAVYEFIIG